MKTSLQIVFDRETDGRWIAEVPFLPGVLAYGQTKMEARRRVSAVALRTLADRVEVGRIPKAISQFFTHDKVAGR